MNKFYTNLVHRVKIGIYIIGIIALIICAIVHKVHAENCFDNNMETFWPPDLIPHPHPPPQPPEEQEMS